MSLAYNTQKVRIGWAYVPPARPIYCDNELQIQRALINKRKGGMLERLLAAIWRAV